MKSCFVCMPLCEDLESVYYSAILKEVEALGGRKRSGVSPEKGRCRNPERSEGPLENATWQPDL